MKIKRYFPFLLAMFALGGCQIQPLYSAPSDTAALNGDSVSVALRSIDISLPKSRLDQLVRNELQFALTGSTDRAGDLPFELLLKTNKKVTSVGISDVDFGPRAFFVTVTAEYVLKDSRKAVPVGQGSEEGTASYDRVDQEFANVRAERAAEIQAAKAAALRLRQALALAIENAR